MIKKYKPEVIESDCCSAPSTSMSPMSPARLTSKNRRCVRCRQAFCAIKVTDTEEMRPLAGTAA